MQKSLPYKIAVMARYEGWKTVATFARRAEPNLSRPSLPRAAFSILTNRFCHSHNFSTTTQTPSPSPTAAASAVAKMEAIGVLMTCPMNNYLEQELDKRFKLFRYWTQPKQREFLVQHAESIRAVVGNATAGADAELIDALPKLEIVSSFSVGLDKVDLNKCKEKGIRVSNTPDVLTDDVADLAIGLMLAVLRRICECDKYVRRGAWKLGDFKLTTKVCCLILYSPPFRFWFLGIQYIYLGLLEFRCEFDAFVMAC